MTDEARRILYELHLCANTNCCAECRHRDYAAKGISCVTYLKRNAIEIIERLIEKNDELTKELAAAKSGWISVEDRLPESDGDYLVCDTNDGDYGVYGCFFDSGYAEFGSWGSDYDPYTHGSLDSKWYKEDTITHWQPMPEPPKEVFNELQCSKNESP